MRGSWLPFKATGCCLPGVRHRSPCPGRRDPAPHGVPEASRPPGRGDHDTNPLWSCAWGEMLQGVQHPRHSLGAQEGGLQPLWLAAVPQFPLVAQREEGQAEWAQLGCSELKLTVKAETEERRKHRRLGALLPHTEKTMWCGGSPDSDQFSSVPAQPQRGRGRSLRAEGLWIALLPSPTEPYPPLGSPHAAPHRAVPPAHGDPGHLASLSALGCAVVWVVWGFFFSPFPSSPFFFIYLLFT